MAVSLQKGQKVSLKKGETPLTTVLVGLGWDEAAQKRGLFSGKPQPIDCDASVILLQGGKLVGKDDLVYFGNLSHRSGCVVHLGDNRTGAGEGDDEQILVDLAQVPQGYDRLVVVVNIYECATRKQHFGLIENAFIRIVDSSTQQEMFRFSLTEQMTGKTALILGEIYQHGGEWKFGAVGQGTTDVDLGQMAKAYT